MNPQAFQRPEVAVNFALTWDGRVSTRNWTSSDFSSPRDKHRMLEIRASGDAVLVGRATLEKEDTRLGLPDPALRTLRVQQGKPAYPLRVLVSNSGRFNPELSIFETGVSPVVVFATRRMPAETRTALSGKAKLELADAEVVDLRAMLRTLWDTWAVRRLVCEGGPTLFRALLEEELVDELNVTFCPRIFGGQNAPTLTGCVGEFLQTTREFRLEASEVIDAECFLRYRARVR